MTVGELLQHTAARLAAPELLSEDPVQEARELVAHALGVFLRTFPRARWRAWNRPSTASSCASSRGG